MKKFVSLEVHYGSNLSKLKTDTLRSDVEVLIKFYPLLNKRERSLLDEEIKASLGVLESRMKESSYTQKLKKQKEFKDMSLEARKKIKEQRLVVLKKLKFAWLGDKRSEQPFKSGFLSIRKDVIQNEINLNKNIYTAWKNNADRDFELAKILVTMGASHTLVARIFSLSNPVAASRLSRKVESMFGMNIDEINDFLKERTNHISMLSHG